MDAKAEAAHLQACAKFVVLDLWQLLAQLCGV